MSQSNNYKSLLDFRLEVISPERRGPSALNEKADAESIYLDSKRTCLTQLGSAHATLCSSKRLLSSILVHNENYLAKCPDITYDVPAAILTTFHKMGHLVNPYEELYQLSRLALTGRRQDIQMFIRRLARRLRSLEPAVAAQLDTLIAESPTQQSPLRNATISAVPVDVDSRLQLAKYDYPIVIDVEPIWSETIRQRLDQVVQERLREDMLLREGLFPTKSLLFYGPPGVGKSLGARWLASRLDRPLLTLNLSAVMSSFLGRTGSNVRHVLDYAKSANCVLLLDELDAVAKRRDDASEIGELKRLVTVLLQEIDDWPPSGILVAATNHPDLLDPAIWRRFEMVIPFSMPNEQEVQRAVDKFLRPRDVKEKYSEVVAQALLGLSFSDIERELSRVHREAVISGNPIEASLRQLVHERSKSLPVASRKQLAIKLLDLGLSQREASEWTGVHRKTIRDAVDGDSETHPQRNV